MMSKSRLSVVTVACFGFLVGTAQGQSTDDWTFQITPYAWMSGLEGNIGTISGLPSSGVELSFRDILDDLELAGMLFASARKGPWVFYLDTTYANLSNTASVGGAIRDVRIDSETTTFSLAVGRTVHETPESSVQAYLGARAWWLNNRITVRGSGGGARDVREKEDWVNPLIGVAANHRVSERWSLFGAAEVGGFGVGADSEWSVIFGGTFKIRDGFDVNLGWRHLSVDYDDNGVLFDAAQSGPLVGATFRF